MRVELEATENVLVLATVEGILVPRMQGWFLRTFCATLGSRASRRGEFRSLCRECVGD